MNNNTPSQNVEKNMKNTNKELNTKDLEMVAGGRSEKAEAEPFNNTNPLKDKK